MFAKIKAWYEGKFTPYESDPNSRIFILGWDYERHWTAKTARVLVEFYLREWKWIIGTAIATVAVVFKVVN